MMSALDMLKLRLGQPGQSIPQVMPSPEVLAALAERQRAWQMQTPSYGEGEVIPGSRNPLMEQEDASGAFAAPQREERLMFDRAEALGLLNPYGDPWQDPRARALPEGGAWASRPPDVPPYSSPLNQMLQRPPFGLY